MLQRSVCSCPHEAGRLRGDLGARLHGPSLQVRGGEEVKRPDIFEKILLFPGNVFLI